MRIVAVAFAGLTALGSGSALAGDLAQVMPNAVRADVPVYAVPRYQIATVVRSMGLEPVGTPVRAGTTFIQRAVDLAGTVLRVTIDVGSGAVLAVHPVVVSPYGAPPRYGMTPTYGAAPVYRGRYGYDGPPYGGPYGYRGPYDGGPYGYRGAYDGGPYRPYAAAPPMGDDDVVVAPHAAPRAPVPNTRSTALEPKRAPVPKPKPRPTRPAETTMPGTPAQTKPVAAAPPPKPAAPAAPSAAAPSPPSAPTYAPLHVP